MSGPVALKQSGKKKLCLQRLATRLLFFFSFSSFFFVRVCVSMITLMCICVCESVLPSTACSMEVVKVSGGPNEAELRVGISNVTGPLPLAF